MSGLDVECEILPVGGGGSEGGDSAILWVQVPLRHALEYARRALP